MKMTKFILVITFALFTAVSVQAQKKDKKADKATKKKIRTYLKNPAAFRKMMQKSKDDLQNLELKLSEVEEQNKELTRNTNAYKDSLSTLRTKMAALETTNATKTMDEIKALEYRVQIGVYELNDFNGAINLGHNAVKVEEENGSTKYYVGSFDNPFDAESFAEAIRAMGLRDAFVAKFVQGVREAFDINDLK